MLQIINQGNQSKIRVEAGVSFYQMSSNRNVDKDEMLNCDGILITAEDAQLATTLIQWVRTHQIDRISLKPLFATDLLKKHREIDIHIDGYFDEYHLKEVTLKSSRINQRLAEFRWSKSELSSFQTETSLRLIRFMYSREISIEPRPSRDSKIGFKYPYISCYYQDGKDLECLEILEKAKNNNYLNCSVNDKIHTCKSCHSNYLNFRESCSSCSSIDLKTENIIHHFVCAHVAPESDFIDGDQLKCPKCDKTLRHIGIDYDKPSTIHKCNSCNHDSQQTEMKAKCIDCNHESALSDLEEFNIYEFELTSLGINSAINGFDKANVEESDHDLNFQVFELLLKQEGVRTMKSKGQSVYGRCIIKDESIQQLNSTISKGLDHELFLVLQKHIETPEVLAKESAFSYVFLLPDITLDEGIEKTSKIKLHLGELLSDNLSLSKNAIEIQLDLVNQNSSLKSLEYEGIIA